jgi:hypothetical protein
MFVWYEKYYVSLLIQNQTPIMKKLFLFALILFTIVTGAYSQESPLKPQVDKPVYFDVSPPLRDMIMRTPAKADRSWKDGVIPNKFAPPDNRNAQEGHPAFDPSIQKTFGYLQTDTTLQNFSGVGATGSVPPDTHGDVSPLYYFQVVNTSYAIYNKSGVKVFGPVSNSTVWDGMPNNSNDGDAVVLYDENAQRWLFSQFSLPNYPSGPFYQNIAISETSDPMGSWYRYQYSFSLMPDYPKFGVWGDGYYMSSNNFGASGFANGGAYGYDRTAMLAGNPSATRVSFTVSKTTMGGFCTLLPSDCDGTFPPTGTPAYFTYLQTSSQYLRIYEFHADFATPTNSTFGNYVDLTVNSFSTFSYPPSGIQQKGTTIKLDPISDRLMYRAQYRVFNGYSSIVLNHTININNKGAIRWYELRKNTGNWAIYQQSSYEPADGNSRWMGSISIDTAGSIALGYSISSSSLYPGIRYTGRLKSDPLNQMTIAEKTIINGGGSQTGTWDGRSRWGDYSGMCVDPSCPTTFWYTQEYYSSTSDAGWVTRVGSFTFQNVFSTMVSATPPTVCSGTASQLNLLAYGGSGNYTYDWSSIPTGFSSNIANPSVTPEDTTLYIAVTTDGTNTRHDTIQINVVPHPTAFAGNDTLVCNWITSIPVHGVVTDAKQIGWMTSGNGTFADPYSLNTTYTFGTADKNAGNVNLSLVAFAKPPCTGKATDQMHVVLDPCTGIPVQSNDKLSLSVNPNPTQGPVTLNISGLNEQGLLSLTGMDGKNYLSVQVEPSNGAVEKKFDLAHFNKGVYIIKLKTSDQVLTEKLVIQ